MSVYIHFQIYALKDHRILHSLNISNVYIHIQFADHLRQKAKQRHMAKKKVEVIILNTDKAQQIYIDKPWH